MSAAVLPPATVLVVVVFVAVDVGMAPGRWPGLKVDRTGIAVLCAIALTRSGMVVRDRLLPALSLAVAPWHTGGYE